MNFDLFCPFHQQHDHNTSFSTAPVKPETFAHTQAQGMKAPKALIASFIQKKNKGGKKDETVDHFPM